MRTYIVKRKKHRMFWYVGLEVKEDWIKSWKSQGYKVKRKDSKK